MQASIITPEETLNYQDIYDMVINTPYGKKHINNSNGNVDPVKRGKLELLIKTKSGEMKTVEFYVDNGVAYVENKVINIVTSLRNKPRDSKAT